MMLEHIRYNLLHETLQVIPPRVASRDASVVSLRYLAGQSAEVLASPGCHGAQGAGEEAVAEDGEGDEGGFHGGLGRC